MLRKHSHREAHLCLVLGGLYVEEVEGATELRLTDTLIFYGPDVPHSEIHFLAGRHFLVNLDLHWLADNGVCLLPRACTCNRPLVVEHARRLHQMIHATREFRNDAEVLLRHLLDLLAEELRPAGCGPRWMGPLIERIRRTTVPESLTALADSANFHPSHLAREFHRSMGCSLGAYRRRLQLEKACRLVTFGADSLANIAIDAGYCDQSHLSREVKRCTGLTPAQLRRAATFA